MDIFQAARENNVHELKKMLYHTTINSRDDRGSTAMIIASYYNHTAVIKILIQWGADLELKDNLGNTALMGASFKGHKETVSLLLDAGAEINAENEQGATAVTFAAAFGKPEIVSFLLEFGASLEKKKLYDRMRLMYNLCRKMIFIRFTKSFQNNKPEHSF